MERRNTSECNALFASTVQRKIIRGIQPTLENWEAVVIIVGFGVFAIILAKCFSAIRQYVYEDKDNLDTQFDAGGKVSIGLTATTIVSQWTWAATLLQSSAVASQFGISGIFWYAAGASIQILLFSMLSIQLKIRAPGAKTFLQVVRARFGNKTHLVFCAFALLTNIIVTAMLMLGGIAVLTNLVKGMNVEMATMLVTLVIGSYSYIGGLGATFYVSYFNTGIIFITTLVFVFKVYLDPLSDSKVYGSANTVFSYLSCSVGPEGNTDQSYLTMRSHLGLVFGIINIVGNFGTVFVDQAYWQSAVAAKPKEGVWGFLAGGMVWFAVPFTFATTMGLVFVAMGAEQGLPLLSDDDISKGLVPPMVAQVLMGRSGELMMVLIILMAVTSTGSAEIIAVTSIMVYDIYMIHLKPYRLTVDTNSCILCGKGRGRMANPRDKCVCESMTFCANCESDDQARKVCKRAIKPDFKCKVHGPYRVYIQYLRGLKNWCLLWVTVSIVPLTFLLNSMQISLGWVYNFMGVLVGSAVVPISLAMFWTRLNSVGMVSGAVAGIFLGIVAWLAKSAMNSGGLSGDVFVKNTGDSLSMLTGNLVAIFSSGIITVIVTFLTNRSYNKHMLTEIWENTRDIDNPLSPWTELYARELKVTGGHHLDNRPSLAEVEETFKNAKYIAYVGAALITFVLVVLWPCCMLTIDVMTQSQFSQWVYFSVGWTFIAALFITVMPLMNEFISIRGVIRTKRMVNVLVEPTSKNSRKESNSQPSTSGVTKKRNGVGVMPLQGDSVRSLKDVGDYGENFEMSESSTGAHTPVFP
ncbi:uncharacterized protein LOC135496466 [Lineus longissimus]|uniref:uncharacterized protein LOC135496466 n=1 Tax=Lineus longissimus TaxID=88925 RepID=UPI002B4C7551